MVEDALVQKRLSMLFDARGPAEGDGVCMHGRASAGVSRAGREFAGEDAEATAGGGGMIGGADEEVAAGGAEEASL